MNKERLLKIIEELREVRTEAKAKVSDEVLWDTAVRIHNSEEIQAHRQGKTVERQPPFNKSLSKQKPSFPASTFHKIDMHNTKNMRPETAPNSWMSK